MSVRIEFDLEQIYPETAASIIAMLEKKFPAISRSQVLVETRSAGFGLSHIGDTPTASSVEPTRSASGEPSEPAGESQAKRRGRPRKDAQPEAAQPEAAQPEAAQPEAAPVDPTSAQSGPAAAVVLSAEPPSQSAPAGETAGPKVYTLDELRAGLQTYTGKHDLAKSKALLKSFGCDRITELAEKGPEVHRQFMKECDKAKEQADA